MEIEIVNLQTVKADSVIYGNFTEAASRLPKATVELQSALEAFVQSGEDAKMAIVVSEQKLQSILSVADDKDALAAAIAEQKLSVSDQKKVEIQQQIDALQSELASIAS